MGSHNAVVFIQRKLVPVPVYSGGDVEPFVLQKNSHETQIQEALDPVVQSEGYELVDLDVENGQSKSRVVLYLDTQDEDTHISMAQLEFLSGLLGDTLDVVDSKQSLFRQAYTLEVSSPGIERPLCKKSHFDRAHKNKELIKVRTRGGLELAKSITGHIKDVAETGIHVDAVFVPWEQIRDAHVVFVMKGK